MAKYDGSPESALQRPDYGTIADLQVTFTTPFASAWHEIQAELRARLAAAMSSHDPLVVEIKINRVK